MPVYSDNITVVVTVNMEDGCALDVNETPETIVINYTCIYNQIIITVNPVECLETC